MGPPEYLVTAEVLSAEPPQRVCGFLIKYYDGGALEHVLSERRKTGTLTLRQQMGWARDLVASLVHIRQSPAKFYSDLRLDQLVPWECGAEHSFDPLDRFRSGQQLVFSLEVGRDRLVELVAADGDRPGDDDPAERHDRAGGVAGAEVEDHRGGRLADR